MSVRLLSIFLNQIIGGDFVRVLQDLNTWRGVVVAAAAWGLYSTSAAAAEPKPSAPRESCNHAQKRLAEAERQGHLKEARDAAASCSASACGAWLSQQCRTRAAALALDIPSVVPIALDEAGVPVSDLELRVDGALVGTQVSGRAVELDPGVHEFAFSAPGRQPHVEKLVVSQGVRNHQLSVVLQLASNLPSGTPSGSAESPAEAAGAAPAVAPSSGGPASAAPAASIAAAPLSAPHAQQGLSPQAARSAWPYVIGGVGLASLGVTVAFATWGHQDNELLDRCAPNCKQASVEHVKNMYLAADVSLGVGVVALGVATWLYFSESSAAPPADHAGLNWDVRPVRGGAFATVEQAF